MALDTRLIVVSSGTSFDKMSPDQVLLPHVTKPAPGAFRFIAICRQSIVDSDPSISLQLATMQVIRDATQTMMAAGFKISLFAGDLVAHDSESDNRYSRQDPPSVAYLILSIQPRSIY